MPPSSSSSSSSKNDRDSCSSLAARSLASRAARSFLSGRPNMRPPADPFLVFLSASSASRAFS